MNEKIVEKDELGEVGSCPLKGKGKEKESLRLKSEAHSRLGRITAAVIEDLSQVAILLLNGRPRLRIVLC